MSKFQTYVLLLVACLASLQGQSQITSLVCNDLITVALSDPCNATISAGAVLEGGPYQPFDYYTVELDKTPPFGNGPWVPAIATAADIGKTYQIRVKDPVTTNSCWGSVTFNTYLICDGIKLVNLASDGTVTLTPADLNYTYSNACQSQSLLTTLINGVPAAEFDCTNIGINTIQVTAQDPLGNASTCNAQLVVNDPTNACNSCITCPPTSTVSYTEAANTLYPAYQSGNWAAFEAFGTATYNPACANITDSAYTVTYAQASQQNSWFIRRWEGFDANGVSAGTCEQAIIFASAHTITIDGLVYADSIQNCQKDASEAPISILNIIVTKFPSQVQQTITPVNGAYSLNLDITGADSLIVVELDLPAGVSTACPTTIEIPAISLPWQHTIDFGVQTIVYCPSLEVQIDALVMRRCVDNYLYVHYANLGLLEAQNAYVTVVLDPLLTYVASSIPATAGPDNTYTFQLGTVPPLSSGNFLIRVNLDCAAQVGQTICSQADISPAAPCDPFWGGPVVATSAYCTGDSVKLAIWNKGGQNMTESLNFIVIEDIIMYQGGQFKLDAGDSMTITMAANGATWRIEAQQVPDNPIADAPSSSIESCNGLTPGLVNAFPANDDPRITDIACIEVTASLDPNDKTATPTGYGPDHTLRANTDIEYKIRFQNTGNDTAFQVVIIDTLPNTLDWASVEAGASSHPYRLNVYQGGILHFVFDPIALPDSNVNEAASHGFVSFRIAQKADLPSGTVINNTVSIYFDFNDPVVTNTTWHTIGEPFIAVATQQPIVRGVAVSIMPNPFHDRAIMDITGTTLQDGVLEISDPLGRLVSSQIFQNNRCTIEKNGLAAGVYYYTIRDRGMVVAGGKLMVH